MTLVKSLYSGDPDVIQKHADLQRHQLGNKPRPCKGYSAYFPDKAMYLAHELGRPCRGPAVVVELSPSIGSE
jgi:hypothetical protein